MLRYTVYLPSTHFSPAFTVMDKGQAHSAKQEYSQGWRETVSINPYTPLSTNSVNDASDKTITKMSKQIVSQPAMASTFGRKSPI